MQDPQQTPILGYPLPNSAEQKKWKLGKLQTGMSAELLWIWWECCNSWRSTIQTRSSKAVAPNHMPCSGLFCMSLLTHPFQVWVLLMSSWPESAMFELRHAKCAVLDVLQECGWESVRYTTMEQLWNSSTISLPMHQTHIYMFHRAKCHLKSLNTIVNNLFLDPSTLR